MIQTIPPFVQNFVQNLVDTVWLTPVYPLASFLLIFILRNIPLPAWRVNVQDGYFKKEWAFLLTAASSFMGLIHALAGIWWLFAQNGHVTPIFKNIPWLGMGAYQFSIGYQLDSLSVMMLFVVTFISFCIHVFTHSYMGHDKGYSKFFAFLSLFNFAMLGLVLSTNLFQSYIFWELVGVCSYLLIGFWTQNKDSGPAAIKAFLVNKVGDFGFMLGIMSLLLVTIGWWTYFQSMAPGDALLSFNGIEQLAPVFKGLTESGKIPGWIMPTVALLIFMGPMAKSAQVPLHTWLPDAMAGPTPISALIHAATMVAAGVYLSARVYPLFQAFPGAMEVVMWIGLVTAVIGATIAMTQYDIKKALAYSTMSQLGFMMTALGCGSLTAGVFHLFTHAFFKAMLFLGSGSVIHAVDGEQDMRHMGGLHKHLPITGTTYLIGTIAISGLLWTSGFWSKDEVLLAAQGVSKYPFVFPILAATAGLTAFYMFRTYFMTFTGKYRGEAHVHHEDLVLAGPLVVLALPSLAIGGALSGVIPGLPTFAQYIHAPVLKGMAETAHHGAHHAAWFSDIGNLSQLIGLSGFLLALFLYGPVRLISPELIRKTFLPLDTLFRNKWWFDELHQAVVTATVLKSRLWSWFDKTVIDGLVNLTAKSLDGTGGILRALQAGSIQAYLAVAVFGFLCLSLVMLNFILQH
jgi:NAD(P)H-quinone oxidoreductase subunit 5